MAGGTLGGGRPLLDILTVPGEFKPLYYILLSAPLSLAVWAHSSKPTAARLLLWVRRAEDLIDCWIAAAAACGGRMRAVTRSQRA